MVSTFWVEWTPVWSNSLNIAQRVRVTKCLSKWEVKYYKLVMKNRRKVRLISKREDFIFTIQSSLLSGFIFVSFWKGINIYTFPLENFANLINIFVHVENFFVIKFTVILKTEISPLQWFLASFKFTMILCII